MDKLKQWVALTVVGCLAILAAGWFLLVSPKKAEAEDLRTQAASQDSTNATLQTKLAMLKAQAKDLPKQQAKLAAVAAKIPENPALPALIRALDSASAEAGVELVSIAPGQPTAVTAAAATTPVAPGAVAAPAGSAAGTLSSIPVAINVVGGYFEVQQFMSGLEGLSRALRVTALTLAPGANPVAKQSATAVSTEDGKSLTATITGSVFMAAGAVQPAVTTPVAPVAAGTTPAVAPGTAAAVPAAVPAVPAK
ncbi:MAG: hypothetical protein JWN17_2986 [Frankiales bacterium]|nr:hypothetical protein [Frankiales bacterium]